MTADRVSVFQLQLGLQKLYQRQTVPDVYPPGAIADAGGWLGGLCTFSLRRASLMGRVARGMGATGCEGASDMAAACAGAIGRLGVSGDGDGSGGGRAGGRV